MIVVHRHKPNNNRASQGQMIIEVVVALAITSIVLVGLVTVAIRTVTVHVQNTRWQNADTLAEEGMEAVRQLRDGYGVIVYQESEKVYETDWVWDDVELEPDPPLWGSASSRYRVYVDRQVPGSERWIMERYEQGYDAHFFRLYKDSNSNYGYPDKGGFAADATITPFARSITITAYSVDGVILGKSISVALSWQDRLGDHSVDLITLLGIW
jgi:type II secretory pathway pseudopilin PulG